ncbi:MAG: T9SS type A sorting domain-containing protein [Ignavibacteriaceae bacterium]|nr:T9SS type A sorting domain-containing protein [Ignavibacteriaceae bacterium]
MDENTQLNSNNDVEEYLETEPFDLTNDSEFLYSIQYGSNNNTGSIFGNNEYLDFKVKLIDANTNSEIAVFDDITFNNNNQTPYANLQFNVNTNGIGNRTVKLALDIDDNFNAGYSVTAKYDNSTILAKTNRVNIGLGENVNATTYDIFQNYPNPFNPRTTIRYQIPENGMVTLKVYDMLGREVITLVNEYKTKGRYEVTFDASSAAGGLASGLYIYEITSGSFKASKKMTLLK